MNHELGDVDFQSSELKPIFTPVRDIQEILQIHILSSTWSGQTFPSGHANAHKRVPNVILTCISLIVNNTAHFFMNLLSMFISTHFNSLNFCPFFLLICPILAGF